MRLDAYLFNKNYFDSRTKSNREILNRNIKVDGKIISKPSFSIDENIDHNIEISQEIYFVSQGGYKLDKALSDFNFDVKDKTVADVGASTGGFTHCLLFNGAKKVYAVDLNDDLLDKSLKDDDRVITVIKNARYLTTNDFNETLDLITADLSFISIKIILPVFYSILGQGKEAIILIKPQFETQTKHKFKNGIIKDGKLRKQICKDIFDYSVLCGFSVLGLTTAPIKNDKNVEFLIWLKKSNDKSVDFEKEYSKICE